MASSGAPPSSGSTCYRSTPSCSSSRRLAQRQSAGLFEQRGGGQEFLSAGHRERGDRRVLEEFLVGRDRRTRFASACLTQPKKRQHLEGLRAVISAHARRDQFGR